MGLQGVVQTGTDTAGGTIRPLQTKFKIRGAPVGVLGSPVDGHGTSPHDAPTMVQGLPHFRIIQGEETYYICVAGHLASCDHAATGRPWFRVEVNK